MRGCVMTEGRNECFIFCRLSDFNTITESDFVSVHSVVINFVDVKCLF